MQYDGRVRGFPGSRLNVRLLRTAHVYTRAYGITLWGVLGDIGGASGLILSCLAILVHYGELTELWCRPRKKERASSNGQKKEEKVESGYEDEPIPEDVGL